MYSRTWVYHQQTLIQEQPDLVLVTGDLVEGYADDAGMTSQLTTWRNNMQPIYNAGIPVYPIRGGHDLGNATNPKAVWNSVFLRRGGNNRGFFRNGDLNVRGLRDTDL